MGEEDRKNIAKKLDSLMENFGNFESEMKEETRVCCVCMYSGVCIRVICDVLLLLPTLQNRREQEEHKINELKTEMSQLEVSETRGT
jgi:hypothetical protein